MPSRLLALPSYQILPSPPRRFVYRSAEPVPTYLHRRKTDSPPTLPAPPVEQDRRPRLELIAIRLYE